MAWCKHWLVQGVTVGSLLGVGFIVPILWFLSIAGAAWLFWCLQHKTRSDSWKVVLIAWFIKYTCALSWFWSVYPFDWLLATSPVAQLVLIGLYWLTASLWLAGGGFVLWGLWLVVQSAAASLRFILLPVSWVLAELAGALLFSIITFGPGSQITTQFSFGFIGYHLAQHGLAIQLASVAGVYGLTLVLVLFAMLLMTAWQHKRQRAVVVAVLLIVGTSWMSVPELPSSISPTVRSIAIVDTWLPTNTWLSDEGAELVSTQNQAALAAAQAADADYIIFPEDSRLFDQSLPTTTLAALLTFQNAGSNIVIVDSGRAVIEDKTVLQASVFNSETNTLRQAQKRYLVPQGEFMPTLYGRALSLFGYGDTVSFLNDRLAYEVGDQISQADYDTTMPGVLFCFESVSPYGVRTLLQERPDGMPFVAHPISHAWFNEPTILWQQLETMLRIQAIWNDIYIVSAGNHAAGYAVSPAGVVVHPTPVSAGNYWQVSTIRISD